MSLHKQTYNVYRGRAWGTYMLIRVYVNEFGLPCGHYYSYAREKWISLSTNRIVPVDYKLVANNVRFK